MIIAVRFIVSLILSSLAHGYVPLKEPGLGDALFMDDLLDQRISRDHFDPEFDLMELDNSKMARFPYDLMPGRSIKDAELMDYNDLMPRNGHPAIRDQEYLKHSTLDTEPEDSKLYSAKGQTIPAEPKQPDSLLPAYCNPPNPCPVGFTAADGCIEIFENSAAFSREYQASQDCMCDAEHMFDCPASDIAEEEKALEIARNGHPFFSEMTDQLERSLDNALIEDKRYDYYSDLKSEIKNPFLVGEKLPIAAKKGQLHPMVDQM